MSQKPRDRLLPRASKHLCPDPPEMICRGCVHRNRASRLSTQGIQPDDIWDVSAAGLDVSFVCVSGHLLHSHVFSRFVNCPHMSLEASNQQAILAAVSPDWTHNGK